MFWTRDDVADGLKKALPGLQAFFLMVVEDQEVRYISPTMVRFLGYGDGACPRVPTSQIFPDVDSEDVRRACKADNLATPILRLNLARANGELVATQCLVSCGTQASHERCYLVGTIAGQLATPVAESKAPPENSESVPQSQATLAQLAHEIRTPISALIGLLQLLDTSKMPPDQRKVLESISLLTRNVQTLLSDVLDASRIWAGRMVLAKEDFNLRSLAQPLITRYDLLHPQLRIELEYDSAVPEQLYGDPHRIEQVLTNLLSNSVKHTREGSIILSVRPGGGDYEVEICVKDTGEGIPPGIRENIFNAYSRREDSASSDSTGLGLYIVKQIVALHGGAISCISEAGKGCEMRCLMPLIPKKTSTTPQYGTVGLTHLPAEIPESSRRGGVPRILLVDDNSINLMVVGKFLKLWKYPYSTALSGEECLAKIDSGEYGIVLLDIRMPGMDGYQTAEAIRRRDDYAAEIPIVALTASTEQGVVERLVAAGMDSYIFKPFQAAELKVLIEHFVGLPPQ